MLDASSFSRPFALVLLAITPQSSMQAQLSTSQPPASPWSGGVGGPCAMRARAEPSPRAVSTRARWA
eukprot:8691707-Pyramimonas_sp.AAC.1